MEMKTSLDPIFINIENKKALSLLDQYKAGASIFALRHKLANASLSTIIDSTRSIAQYLIADDNISKAIAQFSWLDTIFTRAHIDSTADVHVIIKQVLAALLIEDNKVEPAMTTAAEALSLMVLNSRRKDEGFICLLAMLLYDLAQIHCAKKEFKQAERDIAKSMKLLEKLSKINRHRYGAGQITALNASTSIYRSRVDQANLLAHYQVATTTYLAEVNSGIMDATTRLIASVVNEGNTLSQMNRYREAIHFYTRALKYLTRIEPEFSLQQLQLSISLGEALIQAKNTRDKGVHLLNTMLHKATKLNADDEHKRIVKILLDARNNRLDILGLWHKMFPK